MNLLSKNNFIKPNTFPSSEKRIIILGGGIFAWLTALMVKKVYTSYDVTVIDDGKNNFLDYGESTLPYFSEILSFLDIPLFNLIQQCKGTLNLGTYFNNWNGDEEGYFNGCNALGSLSDVRPMHDICYWCHGYGTNLEDYKFSAKVAKSRLSCFIKNRDDKTLDDPMYNLQHFLEYGFHIDSAKLKVHLTKIGIFRDIQKKTGTIKNINSNYSGKITSILLESGEKIDLDFIFDCSEFSRLLLGSHFKDKWISYKEYLPTNTAVTFDVTYNTEIAPLTEVISMKNGWIRKIPLQNTYKCSYIYDSSYANEDEILKEAEEYFNIKIEKHKTFTFESGSFPHILIKNCMAIGTSQSFLDPLEPISVWSNLDSLIEFLSCDGINNSSKLFEEEINLKAKQRNFSVMNFLLLHYITKRNDSKFWQDINKTSITESLQTIIEFLTRCPRLGTPSSISLGDINFDQIPLHSYYCIALGLKALDNTYIKEEIDRLNLEETLTKHIQILFNEQTVFEKTYTPMTHKEFIDYITTYVPSQSP